MAVLVQAILHMLNCKLKVTSPYNHGSSEVERQIKTISDLLVKHLWDKGQMWPLFEFFPTIFPKKTGLIQNGQKWPFQIFSHNFSQKYGENLEWPKMALLNFCY